MKKLLPYGRHLIDDQDINEVSRVLKSDFLTSGPTVEKFEKKFCKYTNAKYCKVFSSGTAALHISSIALGLNHTHHVIVPTVTFLASANAFKYTGANIIFCDIDPETGLMSAEILEETIKKNSDKNIRAVVAVHLNGQPCDLKNIQKVTKKYNLFLIEDACHALGAKYLDTKVGDCSFSDLTMFSFHPVKLLAMGEGGVITTNSYNISEKLKKLRNHGIEKEKKSFLNKDLAFDEEGNVNPWYYEMQELGYNYRASDIHCALGISQLKKVNLFLKKRKNLADIYDHEFNKNSTVIKPIKRINWGSSGWHLYVVQINFEHLKISKSKLMRLLLNKNISTQVHYIPLHLQPYYRKSDNNMDFRGAIKYYKSSLSIPLFPLMEEQEVNYVIKTINEFLR